MKKSEITNEITSLYDIRIINRAFYMVEDAIKIIEDMDLDTDVIANALGLSIKIYDVQNPSNDNQIKVKIGVRDNAADIYNYVGMNKNELTAKAIITCLFYRSISKEGIKDFNLEDIKDEEFIGEFQKKVDSLASRLLIPKKEFSDELGEMVYNASYNEQRGEEQLLSVSLIRRFLIEKLMKKYNVTEHMVNVRLSVADLGDDKYDSLGQSAIDEFKRPYFDSENIKDTSKTKK